MVRETRHLWVGNLPDNIREDRIREHFKRYGRVQSVKLLSRGAKEEAGEGAMACTVAFMDIKSASKAHNAEHKIDDRTLTTEYYEPAAIPSAASPQNTPSSYSTSPGSNRFPNGHGSTEEHANFGDRFYERPNNRVTEGEFIRRTNYHDNCRGRNRDRNYRNGPYNAIMDRSHRTLNNTWSSYDSTRYNSQNETGYVSTPSDTNERRSSEQTSTKKKTKSRSGSRSPSPSGSTSSRSPSRSRSRSSSSSSTSSTSHDTSSSSEKRPVAIRVKNLPPRSSDTSLKDGLFHEYKKHGKVTWVKVVGQGADRYAIVCFKKPEDVEKALEVSYDKLFFGCKIEVEPYQGYDVEDNDLRPYEAEIDEFHPKATRTLFIGNLEKDVTASDLRKHFDLFGEIIEIDIKKQGAVGSYAFCQYSDIVSVVKAIRAMDGEHLGNNRIKLGFGKSMPTNCVWVDGVLDCNEKYLRIQFEQFGAISKVHVDRDKGQALVFYEQVVGAQLAVNKMRGFSLKGNKIQVDFASRECQESFFEHLEKQAGAPMDRTGFEERRDSVSRTFDATTNRFSRYETPTRPRTASYSSRSSVAPSQPAAIPSPGTPGSVTPRGTGSRSRLRFSDYYDQTGEYGPERHFRNYDEFSQGSGASHEDGYEHEYPYTSPSNVETLPPIVNDHSGTQFVQPELRNLQKERVHLLEQLEECPSSGDELISPKKRLKLDLLENSVPSDVIIEANRDHRKVMEVRRLSDPNLKHHRRPSVDNKHLAHDRYLPHAICKRRKTAGSDSSRTHHYDHSGSESVGGSRPGTPLVDERPEHFPSEPRRVPREREGPLTLPLPRFAAQVMNRGSVSVAGIKGQKDTILSSPPPVTSPRISNPKPPSPVPVPPPASPPPRPPSLSSNSSDSSDITPPSPSLDERIRSLVEKYEKWSGSRALSAAGGEALAKLDATREKFRSRHKLLDLDLKEVQPSEIVKSVMAKRSVFDEDLKRLENVGEKYEPKDFSAFPRVTTSVQISIPTLPPTVPTATQLPKTPTMLSPRSTGTNVTAAKGLQYPFPSHPPSLTPTTPTSTAAPSPASTTSTITRGTNHGDTRLKPCASVASDNRTSSKVNVNRSGVVIKTSEKNSVNIPSDTSAVVTTATTTTTQTSVKTKPSEKPSDKVTNRRDSSSSGSDVKTRRNSDAKKEDSDEKERLEKEKQEKERLEKEKLERERLERESELEKERKEKERREKEEQEKKELEEKEKREREEEERLEKERQEKLEKEKEKERERKKEEEKKHKEDNHEKRKDDHRHRENHSESKHRDNNHTKEHESRSSHEKNRHHIERDAERRKESVKENRDNNIHEKKNFEKVESRHMSIDFDRNKSYENIAKIDPSKRKERNNSLPANIGIKRRLSAHDSVEHLDEVKKMKLSQDHKKLSERRDSKDSTRSDEKAKSKHKNNTKVYDDKVKHNNTKEKDRDERHKNKQKLEKHKIKSKSREKECRESPTTPKSPGKELSDKDFLARLDLRSNEEVEKQKQRKESKDKKKLEEDETKKSETKKDKHLEKSKSREDSRSEDKKCQKKDRTRKLTQNSSDNSDSDEPKKHSIFDIVDDEPAYISMYDKVKARSCKNMQKQEEEKRQEKIKAKFSQLKQSRAKREEKKRSTSWDEDSDSDRERSDKIDHKTKRGNKMLIMSSDEDEPRKSHKKREIYSDSDSERPRQIKSEHNETSEDDRVKSKLQRKGSKSRITSDTSDDELKKNPIKSEIFSDNEVDQGFADSEDKPFAKVKDEFNRIIKKARDKHQETIVDQMNAQIFGDSSSPLLDIKTERFNNRHSFIENSSADENNDKKERIEVRKKHKKKQKRQKHSLSSEECNKLETVVDGILTEEKKHHEKKKQHSKKDKKRDKPKDERDKSKKSKKNKSDLKSDLKRDGKMENIFGSLSEDSESGVKESDDHKPNFLDRFGDTNIQSSVYASDSDREPEKLEKERESKEEHRKRKERKRREKERRLQEEAASEQINENSMDYADMGKQLEANIKDDSMEEIDKNEIDASHDTTDDSFRFNENEIHEKKEDRKEPREKKKKRKKSKEEKQKHHHHHHHDKNKVKTEVKKEPTTPPEEIKVESEESKSLPNLTDPTPSPPQNKSSSSLDFSISPVPREALISPIPKTPTTSKEKKRDKLIPGFGTEIDEKLHENAVKSISEFEPPKEVAKQVEETKPEPAPESSEEKPRVVISQEETEDAVAALLGESFGSGQFDECYNEEEISSTNDQSSNLGEGNIAQDDEEMRQAVQSLSANDIDVKPETPQSEHELQIDTDTEEAEETSNRFDQPPKTPEITEQPKAPELPSFYRPETKATPNIGSPPSLTPIKPQVSVQNEIKRPEEPKVSLSLPMLPEQPRSVISQAWNIEKKDDQANQPKIRTYGSPPIVKITEPAYPPLAALTKQEHPQISSAEPIKIQTYPVLTNQKIQMPVCAPKTSTPDSPKVTTSTNLSLSRLPITPIMVSKPLQATTVLLPQAKIAHSLEPPVLVSTSDPRPQERPRMVFQTTSNITPHFPNIVQSPPRMVRSLPPQALLMPARQLPPTPYSTSSQSSVPKPTIIMSTSQLPTSKPFMPVIKETPPKLVTIPEIKVTQPAVIQQTKEIKEEKPPETEIRTSTPSPVIVQTPKEPEKKPEIEEPTPPPPPSPQQQQQLAIEKVTEELNLTLKKETDVKEEVETKKEQVEEKLIEEKVQETLPDLKPKLETLPLSTVKDQEEEKADTESGISDISKERSSAEILTNKDDPLDNKEDSDYWSAKEVNIDSVIKILCSADELSDHSSETGKDDWLDESKTDEKSDDSSKKEEVGDEMDDITENDDKETAGRGGRRGGRARGRKTRGGMQNRRGKPVKEVVTTTVAKRGGRGGCRQKGERKLSKSESDVTSDVYEFRDDSDENKERPRLILTIKSPAAVNTQAVVKEVSKDVVKEPSPKPETKEEFLSPVANTRKSRRLQERDVLRNTVDDTIEDVVRNTVVTRSNQNARRSTRQAVVNKPSPETPRKSPRGGRKKDRRASDPSEDSSEEKSKTDSETRSESDLTEIEKPKEVEKEGIKEPPHEGLKVKMLRRVKGEMQEPTNLIDPVTGLLTPMRECEEGRYIPMLKTAEAQQQSVIASPQQPKPKPQSLKAHVLSSQAAKAVVSQQQQQQQPPPQPIPKKSIIVTSQPVTIQPPLSKPTTPLSQALNVNVSMPTYTAAHLSPRHTVAVNVLTKALTKPQLSPNQMAALNQKQMMNPILTTQSQIINLKQPPIKQPVINKAKPVHQQQMLTGSVASPPLNKGPMPGLGASQNRIVQPPHPKGVMEPPKIDVSLSNVILGPRSNLSPQSQLRHVPMPAYEASLHGERNLYNRSRSPPPAHQNSPSPQGEAIAHFPPGAVPLRPPHDLPPGHYIHPHMYQLMRQQPYHLSRSPMVAGTLEKSGDGQEGEEAPVTSPPLELRRPGSVGLALTGRTAAVPHSLHSPHDRTTDSPQVGQVYNVHTARMQHYHSTGRYYEQTAEPPPAHRPLTSHTSLTALPNDRSMSHMAALGAPERPLSMQPDRPLSSHSALAAHMGPLGTPERPMSTHLPAMGAGLGAAGNLMGAVARHVGVDAPASQRGLQAATPPHASQVPPQAESLFMLLKQYPCMWQGLLALKNDQAAVQMYFVSGNDSVAKCSLPKNTDGSTPPLRIFQRMRLEPPQVEGVARKMQMENEHCMLLALPCGHDHMDVLKQSTNLTNGFITYLQQKQAAGIVNVAAPGTTQPPAYVVHIFPSCDFVNENLRRIAPSLLERVADIAHLLIVITTV
ncbi:protein split ends isoform X1 [Tribolium castaneum]|uniref:protein split ends isoform X1 n=1 Tax=Tribolium castaneum TaxID=7070 RepID=UPI00046C003B|nr:PREDICTED: protein split ends isoform X1 [Tribolium castaneum]|eukprot:XP_008196762.1 PREDICTED: protein split ends isoform X1 [Tribolium castaneum]